MAMNEHAGRPPQPTSPLNQFEILAGEWETLGSHPGFPSAVQGHATFQWLKEDAPLVWHSDWERPGPPSAISVIGHDDSIEACTVLYADERSVARIYQTSQKKRRLEDVENFARLLTTHDGHIQRGWKRDCLAWRTLARWISLGTRPGCNVYEKALRRLCPPSVSVPRAVGTVDPDRAARTSPRLV